MRPARIAAALALLLLAPAAARAESPRLGSFELGAGTYRPDIDSAFAAPGPYEQVFGTRRGWMFRASVSREIFSDLGTLEVGFRTGFFRASGHALSFANGVVGTDLSADTTTFQIVPTSLTLTYRFDLLADRYGIPLAPYGRVALERYNWWVTGGSGSTSKRGATNGYSFSGGLAFLLDYLDAELARELDNDSGINHTYLFVDVTKSRIDDFGSSKSWDLSDPTLAFAFGIWFVF